ncbi:MAG: YlbF family regulator [Streptococcaceae bacterium]|nr:YlbF family regulator [Streptococcaceae bacterium]
MLHVDEDLLAIDALIEAVVAEILASDEAKTYQEAAVKFDRDAEIAEKIARLDENRAYLPYREDLRALAKEINVHPTVYGLKLAENDLQRRLSNLTKEIASAISKDIRVDDALPLGLDGKGESKHGHRRNA